MKLEFNENQVIKLDLNFGPTNIYKKFWFWKYSPQLGPFLPFSILQSYFWGWSQVQKLFSNIPIETINFGFDVQAYLLFLIRPCLGPLLDFFGPLGAISLDLLGLFLGSRSGSKTFLELTNVDYQILFWKYSHIYLF